jgi:hypothetical protein
LASLLTDEAHRHQNGNVLNRTDDVDSQFVDNEDAHKFLSNSVHTVQAFAAWVVGTVVKNTEEFAGYATEPIVLSDRTTTVLDLVLSRLMVVEWTGAASNKAQMGAIHKFLYALGSCLRGNRAAQHHFVSKGGPEQLGRLLSTALLELEVPPTTEAARKVLHRIISLADDLVMETTIHQEQPSSADHNVARSFASNTWCESILRAVQMKWPGQEAALRAMRSLHPHCHWPKSTLVETIENLRRTWEAEGADEDPDIQNERLSFLAEIDDVLSR